MSSVPARLPSFDEIAADNLADAQLAAQNHHGKTIEDIEAIYREGLVEPLEDLCYMGPVGFCYYVRAAVNYIAGEIRAARDAEVGRLAMAVRGQLGRPELRAVRDLLIDLSELIQRSWKPPSPGAWSAEERREWREIGDSLRALYPDDEP
jgi:hypothetical protein